MKICRPLSFALLVATALSSVQLFAWSESGHHLVSVLAFEHLSVEEQQQLLEMLAAHPRFAEDFEPSEKITNVERWRIGVAGYWPDIARRQPRYHRPKWHYQLAATLTLGDPSKIEVDETPGPLSDGATMQTANLHIAQAVDLCRRVMADRNAPPSDRALALCWLSHLVGDAHQPCHAGSLYAEGVFPQGDRGANSIPTKQRGNMHALWDGLLGGSFDEGRMNRVVAEITSSPRYAEIGEAILSVDNTLDPLTWLEESREFAREYAYTPEVLGPIQAAMREGVELQRIEFSESYLKTAGNLSQFLAARAGYRLAEIWREGLTGPSYESASPKLEEPANGELTHWLNSNGVRHNSSCDWFENTKRGRLCGPDEGRPCGICGG